MRTRRLIKMHIKEYLNRSPLWKWSREQHQQQNRQFRGFFLNKKLFYEKFSKLDMALYLFYYSQNKFQKENHPSNRLKSNIFIDVDSCRLLRMRSNCHVGQRAMCVIFPKLRVDCGLICVWRSCNLSAHASVLIFWRILKSPSEE